MPSSPYAGKRSLLYGVASVCAGGPISEPDNIITPLWKRFIWVIQPISMASLRSFSRRPPVPFAKQLHERRDQYHSNDGRIDEDRRRNPDSKLLHSRNLAECERHGDGDHNRGSRSNDPSG